jgi:hypothetical protein
MPEQETISLVEHLRLLREAEAKFQAERDRRYSELAVEREKALAIKDRADVTALELARQIQTYKDEKANELREQINSERGLYATKDEIENAVDRLEAVIKPLSDYVTAQQGREGGTTSAEMTQRANLSQRLVIYGVIISAIVILMNILPYIIGR